MAGSRKRALKEHNARKTKRQKTCTKYKSNKRKRYRDKEYVAAQNQHKKHKKGKKLNRYVYHSELNRLRTKRSYWKKKMDSKRVHHITQEIKRLKEKEEKKDESSKDPTATKSLEYGKKIISNSGQICGAFKLVTQMYGLGRFLHGNIHANNE